MVVIALHYNLQDEKESSEGNSHDGKPVHWVEVFDGSGKGASCEHRYVKLI